MSQVLHGCWRKRLVCLVWTTTAIHGPMWMAIATTWMPQSILAHLIFLEMKWIRTAMGRMQCSVAPTCPPSTLTRATVDGGTCLHEVQFRVDFSQEIAEDNWSWSLLQSTWALSTVDEVNPQPVLSLQPSNAAWHTVQFTVLLGSGMYEGHVIRPDGEAETILRAFEVNPGDGHVDLGTSCFNQTQACPGCTDPMDVAFNPWAS